MLVRYSKKHVRRQQDKTHADWVSVDDSELVVTCNPPGWRVPREFDFAFLVPFATTTLANSVALAFGRFAVRFARDTAVSRYADFRNLWLAIAAQAEATPNASNLRTGALPEARVVAPDKPRLFHPKVYLFRNGSRSAAIVGSHNLTSSAFKSNVEASVFIESDGNDGSRGF